MNAYSDPIVNLIGGWAAEMGLWGILLRILCSSTLSAFIGMERANKLHSAGLRTFMLVSLGGTAAMMMDIWLYRQLGTGLFLLSAAALIGATMIATNSLFVSSRNQIKGITTSAALLVSCLLGISLGAGLYMITLVTAAVMIFNLTILPGFENLLKDRSNHFEIHLELTSSRHLQDFMTTIRELGLIIDDIETNQAYVNSGLSVYSIAISITRQELKKFKTHKEIIAALATLDYVSHIEEI